MILIYLVSLESFWAEIGLLFISKKKKPQEKNHFLKSFVKDPYAHDRCKSVVFKLNYSKPVLSFIYSQPILMTASPTGCLESQSPCAPRG